MSSVTKNTFIDKERKGAVIWQNLRKAAMLKGLGGHSYVDPHLCKFRDPRRAQSKGLLYLKGNSVFDNKIISYDEMKMRGLLGVGQTAG